MAHALLLGITAITGQTDPLSVRAVDAAGRVR